MVSDTPLTQQTVLNKFLFNLAQMVAAAVLGWLALYLGQSPQNPPIVVNQLPQPSVGAPVEYSVANDGRLTMKVVGSPEQK